MEAELTALREELSSRAKNNNGTGSSNGSNGNSNGTKHELTNHSNVSNGNESENPAATDIASVIKKPEKNNTDIKEEEKVD